MSPRCCIPLALLSAALQAAPTLVECWPAPDTTLAGFDSVELVFSEPVLGVEAEDLLANASPALRVTAVEPDRFVFEFSPVAAGPVSLAWRAEHQITDASDLRLPFSGAPWSYAVDPALAARAVRITEFLADNQRALHDEDGDASDWIELHNAGEQPVALLDWGLSDLPDQPFLWRFPEIVLEPDAYLLVFASGKDRTNVTGRLHTNFRLSADGEFLALTSPDASVQSAFAPAYPPQRTDVAYGRVPADPERLGFFTAPTPGALNSVAGSGFAPDVTFSHPGGSFVDPIELALTTAPVPGVEIRYTRDGTLPGPASLRYDTPLLLTNTARIRARAFVPGTDLLPGPPRTLAWTRVSTNLLTFHSDLPLLVVNTWSNTISSSRNTHVSFELHEPQDGRATLTNAMPFGTRGAAKVRGSSTAGLAKASYAIEWWDEFNQDLDLAILGLPAESEWVLYAPNAFDPVLIHNPFIHQLSRDLGQYSPRTRFVEVFLNRGGLLTSNQYVGVYVLLEKIAFGPDRVPSPRLEPEHLEPPTVTGGYLLKADRLDPGDSGVSAGGGTFALVDPKERLLKSAARRPQLLYLTSYLNAFSKALSSPGFRDPVLGYAPYVDVPHWIDYHIVEVLSGNVDAIVLSSYFYKPRDGPLAYGVHWDFDRALGSTDGRDANPRQWQTGPFFSGPWWSRICADANFWQAWVDRYQELRNGPLHRNHLLGLIDQLSGEVRQAQARDRKRWNVNLRGGSYASEIQLMKNWVSNRVDFIDRQLAQPPRLLVPGGLLTPGSVVALEPPAAPLTNTAAAVIYYTLDGSDPRGFTNALSPNARRYTAPIPITQTTRLVARSWDPGRRQTGGPPSTTPWSGPVTATYTVSPPALALSEIQFQPRVPADSPFPDTAFEFLELVNQGTAPLDLTGCRFIRGVDHRFSTNDAVTRLDPGQRMVVAANPEALRWAYPWLTAIVGPWTGRLANEGERITLIGPLEEVLVDAGYDPARHPLAAGGGFTQVLREEAPEPPNPADPDHWRTSARIGGSPGAPDPIPALRPPVVVNEVRSRSADEGDVIELHNLAPTAPADLSHWWLSDAFDSPEGYRLPIGTVVAPGGFLVIPEREFRAGAATGLDLDGIRGDTVWLFSADPEGTLTGYAHGFGFGAAATGSSFGRVLTSDGRTHVAPMTSPTFGQPNAAPHPGPVVLSELCFDTAGSGASDSGWAGFVELRNAGATPVPLFDPRHPTRTWRVRGSLEFDLPSGVTLAPGERLCLVGFDPYFSPWALAQFNARWVPPVSSRILGPARGRLEPGEGTVRLEQPDPETDVMPADLEGEVWLEVDTVHYHDDGSWPALPADAGLSLNRLDPEGYGNEPRHWAAAPASAGDADTDLDGLADQWELAMGLDPRSALGPNGAAEDADGDGYSNRDELLAGTNPTSAASRLEWNAARGADGRVVVSVQSAPSREYSVLFNDRLGAGTWQLLATETAPPAGGLLQFVDPAVVRSNRFYRLRLP